MKAGDWAVKVIVTQIKLDMMHGKTPFWVRFKGTDT
jgi:hypothetical protein